jgi:hypothetical protein
MKTKLLTAIIFSSSVLIFGLLPPTDAIAEVSVNINIPLPGLIIGAPPVMMVIPGTYAYFAPDVDADIFFYHGYWYRPYRGQWFISAGYNGPWGSIAVRGVPGVLINLPPHYRRVPPYYRRLPYGIVRENWRTWEEERHWDRHDRKRASEDYSRYEDGNPHGGHGMGRGMGMRRRWDD